MSTKRLSGSTAIDITSGMLRFYLTQQLSWIFALTLGFWAVLAQGEEFRYRYVSLFDKAPPEFIGFSPSAINDRGLVSGSVFKCDDVSCFDYHVAIYANGAVTVLQPGVGDVINAGGTIGGAVFLNPTDPNDFNPQAALFRGDKVELIPRLPGELTSRVIKITDSGLALIESGNADGTTFFLYKNGQLSPPLDLSALVASHPPQQSPAIKDMNNQGIITGIAWQIVEDPRVASGFGDRAFRFSPRTGEATLLNPLPSEPHSWGMGINSRGEVLGYSLFGSLERIGTWDKQGNFKTYFTEGTPEFPTISNRLLFNDNNLIVITSVFDPAAELGSSYLIPRPGVRLNLADLVQNLPAGENLFISDINNHGDMIGFGFLLERLGATESASSTASDAASELPAGVTNKRHLIPPVAATVLKLHQYMPRLHALKSGSTLPQDPLESLLLK